MSQCGLGKDAVEYISEPSLVSALVQVRGELIFGGNTHNTNIVGEGHIPNTKCF